MDNKWFWEILSPHNNYIYQLAKEMPASDIWIAEINWDDYSSYYSFSSPHLNHFTSPEEAYQQANKLVQVLNGISYLLYEDKFGYSFIVLGDISNDKKEYFDVENKFGSQIFDVDFTINLTNPHRTNFIISDLIHLMKSDQELLNLFFIFGQQSVDWGVLYQAYDSIKTFLGGEAEVKKLIAENRLKSFTTTANNYNMIGAASRHGVTSAGRANTNTPMTLLEAHTFIDELARIWLKIKGVELPVIKSPKISVEDLFED